MLATTQEMRTVEVTLLNRRKGREPMVRTKANTGSRFPQRKNAHSFQPEWQSKRATHANG
jgi:hypothetical protein